MWLARKRHRTNLRPSVPRAQRKWLLPEFKPLLFGGKFEDLTLACKTCGFTKDIRIARI